MVTENGLLIYRTGHPLHDDVVEEVTRRSREERIAHILGGALETLLRGAGDAESA